LFTDRPPPYSTLFPYTTLFRSRPVFSHQTFRVFRERFVLQTACQLQGLGVTPLQKPNLDERNLEMDFCFVVHRPRLERLHSAFRSEEHTSELQSQSNLVCRLLL